MYKSVIHDNGVEELEPENPRATVCGHCGRAWNDSRSSSCTPVPAGRCPFEYDHLPPVADQPLMHAWEWRAFYADLLESDQERDA